MTQIGAPKLEPINIGTEAKPPFAVRPDPSTLFLKRAQRLQKLAPGHELGDYLLFVAALCRLQSNIAAAGASVTLPSPDRLALARQGAMPPLARGGFDLGGSFKTTLDRLLAAIVSAGEPMPEQAKEAARALAACTAADLHSAIEAVYADDIARGGVAETVLLAAALQIHFTQLAAAIDAEQLQPVADGVCPACGAPPVASAVVGWPSAQNTRFCICSLCATQWNVVRVKCVTCGSTGGISYHALDGQPDTIKGETCQSCKSYVKIFYQVNDPALDPVADDVATLALDLKLAQEGWTRRGVNIFLTGYASPSSAPADETA